MSYGKSESVEKKCTDYYAGGSVARRANTPNSYFESPTDTVKRNFGQYYRWGFQGQFAEEDSETGWNSFELRMYDPVISRWTSLDPYNQYWSPYMSMGNNPVNRVDPDGGLDDVFYDSKTDQTRVVRTNDNFDRHFVDGKLVGYAGQGSWKAAFPGASVFNNYTSFYQDVYGSRLLDENFFAKAFNSASTFDHQLSLFQARQNENGANYLATVGGSVGLPLAAIGAGELGGVALSAYEAGLIPTSTLDAYALYGTLNAQLNTALTPILQKAVFSLAISSRMILYSPSIRRHGDKIFRKMIEFGTRGKVDVGKLGQDAFKIYNDAKKAINNAN
ncbi:hypothetical protein FNH22_31175 [Fulvivirga sp. M361]|nr:hypothetical protein FNH22_31175 [Fulvivirga sp. M361]